MIDIVGSTRLIDAIGDDAWVDILSWHERTFGRFVARYAGEVVDQTGDGFFVSFAEPTAAIDCAVAIQRVLARRRPFGPALDVRIGLHRSSVLRCGLAYRGKGVHEASRIAGGNAGSNKRLLKLYVTLEGDSDAHSLGVPATAKSSRKAPVVPS